MIIAIPISSYMWAGGAELIGNFITAIKYEYPQTQVYLLHNSSNKFTSKIIRIAYSLLLVLKLGPLAVVKDIKSIILGNDKFFGLNNFLNQDLIFKTLKVIETDFSTASLNNINNEYKIDIIVAVSYPLPQKYSGRWVGYITDVQHRRFKNNFTFLERVRRDYIFKQIIKRSNAVMVNSLDVKKDLLTSYGKEFNHKINVLPVSPFPRKEWVTSKVDVIDKYQLPKKYFLISSQLWVHKSHLVAFRALSRIVSSYPGISIICTGDTTDYRNPAYFQFLKKQIDMIGLNRQIMFLGLIPKNDQIQIMRKSIAVLQPSIFEGGPGGGAVQNAIALGVKSIVTDIPINKEIKDPTVFLFKTGSDLDLSKKMLEALNEYRSISIKDIISKGNNRKSILGKSIFAVINRVINGV